MSRDRFSPWATSPEYVRPAPIIRQPVRPEEIRARIAAEDATREGPSAAEYIRRIRDAADDTVTIPGLDISYSPMAMGMNAVPFADEILGLATDALTSADYDESQRAAEQARYEASAAHPWSALAGGVGQAAITAPLSIAGNAVGSTRLIRAANAISPGLVGGAIAGAIGGGLTGAARGEDRSIEERAAQAARGAAPGAVAGGALGTVASGLGAAGNALAGTRSALLGVPARIAGSALTGAGYGVASTPDLSGREITDLPGLAMEAPGNAGMGAAFGAAAGTVGEVVGAVPRARNYVQSLFGDVEGRPIRAEVVPGDETAGIVADLPGGESMIPGLADDLVPDGQPRIRDLGQAAREAEQAARIDTGDIISDFVQTGLRRDPAIARLQTLGMTAADINRAAARYGNDPARLVAAAREFDLLPNRPYDPATQTAAIEAMRRTSGQNVGAFRQMLSNSEGTVSGGSIADDVQSMAEQLAQSSAPSAQSRSRMLSNIANDLRYGPGVRPTVDPGTGEMLMPPERELSAADLLRELDQYSEELSRAYNVREPSPDSAAAMDVRRVLANARDRLAEQEFSDITVPGVTEARNAAEEYARQNRAYQVTSALGGGNRGRVASDARQAGHFRSWLGGMAGATLGDSLPARAGNAVLGYLGSSTAARYLPSLVATANEGGFGPNVAGAVEQAWPGPTQAIRSAISSPAVPPRLDAALQGVDRLLSTNPSAFGRLEGVIRGAASRGTLGAVVAYLSRNNPEFDALIQRMSPQAVQQMEQQHAQSEASNPALIGEDPNAPPPINVEEYDPETMGPRPRR